MADKIGVAVSLYDKWEDLEILEEILRENFEKEYYLAVACSHEEGKDEIEKRKINIDKYIDCSDVVYSPSENGFINLHTRILAQIRESCLAILESNCEYGVHLHADSWILEEETINELTSHLEKYEMGVRGYGPTYRKKNHWTGEVKDQFFFFNAESKKVRAFFSYNPVDLLPHTAVHNSLMYPIIGQMGISNVIWYSNPQGDLMYDESQHNPPFTGVRSGVYNPKWGLFHIAKEDFPNNWGEKIQALYLKENEINSGEKIEEHLEEYLTSREPLISEIKKYESDLNTRLKLYGIKDLRESRNIKRKEKFLNQCFHRKLFKGISSLTRRLIFKTVSFIGSMNKQIIPGGDIDKFSNLKSVKTEEFYYDSNWPKESITDIYKGKIKEEELPKRYSNLWFNNEENQEI